MLSGNCSVNAEIITFNAPIKQKQRLRPPSISAFVHTQQELDQSAVGKRKTEVCSLQSTVFSLKPLAQPRSPPENTSVERLMTRLYFISHSVESGIRTPVFGTAVCVYTIFWPFVFPLLTAFISLFMAFVLCFLFFVFCIHLELPFAVASQ